MYKNSKLYMYFYRQFRIRGMLVLIFIDNFKIACKNAYMHIKIFENFDKNYHD